MHCKTATSEYSTTPSNVTANLFPHTQSEIHAHVQFNATQDTKFAFHFFGYILGFYILPNNEDIINNVEKFSIKKIIIISG